MDEDRFNSFSLLEAQVAGLSQYCKKNDESRKEEKEHSGFSFNVTTLAATFYVQKELSLVSFNR